MYSTWWAPPQAGTGDEAVDERWRAQSGAELVYFHGFDNVYHWGPAGSRPADGPR
jgi:methionyl-tRNA synthetase